MFFESSSLNHHQLYQQEGPNRYGNRKINKVKLVNSATSKNDDCEYPEKRLEAILKGLEDRVQTGRDNLYKLQYQRSDFEFELKSLQEDSQISKKNQ